MNPLVSIRLQTYNGPKFIAEAMEPEIVQKYSNLEIVVSDDNSSDETSAIIEGYKTKTNIPIYIYKHEPNGIGANWNNCVKYSKWDYIKFLFQDDTMLPTCIEKMVSQAVKYPEIGMIYSKRSFIYDNNEKNKDWIKNYSNLHNSWHEIEIENNKVFSGEILLKNKNLLEFPKNKSGEPTAVVLRREVFDKVGHFSKTLKQSLDLEYWYRLIKFFSVLFINEELVTFRLHQHQATNVNKGKDASDYYIYDQLIYKEYFWYLNYKKKVEFLKKYHPMFKLFLRIKRKLRL